MERRIHGWRVFDAPTSCSHSPLIHLPPADTPRPTCKLSSPRRRPTLTNPDDKSSAAVAALRRDADASLRFSLSKTSQRPCSSTPPLQLSDALLFEGGCVPHTRSQIYFPSSVILRCHRYVVLYHQKTRPSRLLDGFHTPTELSCSSPHWGTRRTASCRTVRCGGMTSTLLLRRPSDREEEEGTGRLSRVCGPRCSERHAQANHSATPRDTAMSLLYPHAHVGEELLIPPKKSICSFGRERSRDWDTGESTRVFW